VRQDQKTQPVAIAAGALVGRMVEPTLVERQARVMHRTGRVTAAAGVSLRSVRRIWAAHRFQPHPAQRFKLSKCPILIVQLIFSNKPLSCQS
jgi:hypothetical protein